MKSINKLIGGLITCCLILTACAENQDDISRKQPGPVQPGTFDSLLELFKETGTFHSWDETVVDVVGGDGGVYDPEEAQNKTLREHYSEIGPEFHHFIPTKSIVNLDPEFSDDVPDPLSAYQFWATYKCKTANYWLLSVFALKKEWVSRQGYHEFHAHPVLLITFSDKGKLIDHFLWTYLIDDAEQIYDDVDVSGDTLITGWYSHQVGKIAEIHSRTIITPKGKFKTVYKKVRESRTDI